MRCVKNGKGKLVCRVNEQTCTVEIVQKGCKTLICFQPNGIVEISNTESK